MADGFWEDFDGYFALQAGVFGEVHFTHTAFAEGAEDVLMAYCAICCHTINPQEQ
jgi:hypothetical protein